MRWLANFIGYLALMSLAMPAVAQVAYPPGVSASDFSALSATVSSVQTTANAAMPTATANAAIATMQASITSAQTSADASVKTVNGIAPTAGNIGGLVKSVQSIGPDASGNVAGIATSSQLSNVMIAGDVIQVISPSNGASITPAASVTVLLVNNSVLLAALTVNMPTSPVDGQRFVVSSAAGVTVLTLTGGTIKGGLATLSVSGFARFVYSANAGYWFRTG